MSVYLMPKAGSFEEAASVSGDSLSVPLLRARFPIVGAGFGRILASALGYDRAKGKWVGLIEKGYLTPTAPIWGPGLKTRGRCSLDDEVTVTIRDADCSRQQAPPLMCLSDS